MLLLCILFFFAQHSTTLPKKAQIKNVFGKTHHLYDGIIMMTMMTTTTMRLARRRRRDAVAALVEGQVCWGHQPKGGGGGGGGTEEEEEEEDIAKEAKRYSRKARFFQSSATTTARRRDQQQQNDEGNTRERSNTRPAGEGVVVVLSRARTFTREDVRTFAELTGDANPIHFDSDGEVGNDDDASKHHHQKAIVHGALLVSMFPALVGSAFPGSKYLSQTAKFRRECDVGATVKATVRKMRETRGGTIAEFETIVRCAEDEEKVYVDGVALAKIR